jgi:outer membrane protein OmpA-like peptidoglycan-associated protein
MKMNHTLRVIALTLFVVCFMTPTNASAGEVLSSDDLIKKLDPNSPLNLTFRGLSRTDAKPPSVDLDIRFAFDSDDLLPEARAQLDALGDALSSGVLGTYRFKIIGHTDAVGEETYNLTLSDRRARSVKSYLMGNSGIASGRLIEIGMGEQQLKNAGDPEAPENRRVEVINLGE